MGCGLSSLKETYGNGDSTWETKWNVQRPDMVGIQADSRAYNRQNFQETEYGRATTAAQSPLKPTNLEIENSSGFTAAQEQEDEATDEFEIDRPLPQAPLNWSRGELIGAGAFGRVYLGLNNDNGELMAVKQVIISKEEAVAGRVAQHVVELEKEVNVLKHLDHPNIVRYLGTDRTKDCLNIFLEYVPGGSIASLLSKFGSFQESVIKIYARQILLGLQYLHDHKIMHRDIKGANILVDTDRGSFIKLADFGASKKIEDLVTIDSGVKSIKGTSYWMAPEVIKQTGHGRMADIWSVGCTIIEMATGKPPWSQFSSQVSAMFHIASSRGPPPIPEHLSPEAKDFILLCFNRIPSDRPNATRLLQHPFLADVPISKQYPPAFRRKPQRVQSPAGEDVDRVAKRGQSLATRGMSPEGSGAALTCYSPMADRMAEAARSRSGSTAGEKELTARRESEVLQELTTIDGHLRQSVASHASTRYDGIAEDDLGTPTGSYKDYFAQSESDYNPVEEPTWAHDSYQVGQFSPGQGFAGAASPAGGTPPAYGVKESTAVASPLRKPQQRGQNSNPMVMNGGNFEEIMSFVKEKAQKESARLSVPFGLQAAAREQGERLGSKQQQWYAELEEELAQQRSHIRSCKPL